MRIQAGVIAAFAILAACQPSGPDGGANPLAVPVVEVMALDAVLPAGGDEGEQAKPAPISVMSSDAPPEVARQTQANDPPANEGPAGGSSAPDEAMSAAAPSPAQVACVRGKGVWTQTATGGSACVHYTRDAGKACRRPGDCEGECLARSGSCAPIRPLFGCNEILDDMGRPVTLCLD